MNKATVSAWITQLIAVLCFVLLPGAITLVAPRTGLAFSKSASGPTVTVTRYVWLVVPWRTVTVDAVSRLDVDVTARSRYANTAENRRKGRAGTVQMPTGQLTVVGAGVPAVVQVSPDTVEEVAARFKRFAAAEHADPERFPVYASWGLTYGLGGVMTFLTALYLLGAAVRIGQHLVRRPRQPAVAP
jgi:hypothetical protein